MQGVCGRGANGARVHIGLLSVPAESAGGGACRVSMHRPGFLRARVVEQRRALTLRGRVDPVRACTPGSAFFGHPASAQTTLRVRGSWRPLRRRLPSRRLPQARQSRDRGQRTFYKMYSSSFANRRTCVDGVIGRAIGRGDLGVIGRATPAPAMDRVYICFIQVWRLASSVGPSIVCEQKARSIDGSRFNRACMCPLRARLQVS